MKTIAIISQKGGGGKTTVCLNLAVAAAQADETVAVIDLDPQASAASWSDSRKQGWPAVVTAPAARLGKMLDTARENGATLALIDTAPHDDGAAIAAARAADLVLIPCRPAILDLRAIGASVDAAKLAGTPAFILLNAVPPHAPVFVADAAEAIAAYGIELVPMHLTQRAAYRDAPAVGLAVLEFAPGSRAADEVLQLYNWTRIHIGLDSHGKRKTTHTRNA